MIQISSTKPNQVCTFEYCPNKMSRQKLAENMNNYSTKNHAYIYIDQKKKKTTFLYTKNKGTSNLLHKIH